MISRSLQTAILRGTSRNPSRLRTKSVPTGRQAALLEQPIADEADFYRLDGGATLDEVLQSVSHTS